MDPITGNLTAQERAELKPGTEVVYRDGTPSAVHRYDEPDDALVTTDGSRVYSNHYCRLASFTPANAPAGECAECARKDDAIKSLNAEARTHRDDAQLLNAIIGNLRDQIKGLAAENRLLKTQLECAEAAADAAREDAEEPAQRMTPAELAIAELGRIGRGQ